MFKTRQWRTCFTWLALAAMLAAALMPSLSRALASDRVRNIMMAEICAPSGMDYGGMSLAAMGFAGTDGSDPRKDGMPAGHGDDCAWCRLQADTPVLPGAIAVTGPSKLVAPRPALFYHSPAPLFAWTAAHPRGPPLLA